MNRDEFLRAVASAAKEAGRGPAMTGSAYAQLIIETIEPNRLTTDILDVVLPTRQLQPGDRLVKRTRTYGMPVRTFVRGTEHLADQLPPPREIETVFREEIIAKVAYSLLEVQRGELYTLEQIRTELQNALADEILRRLDGLLSTIWNPTNTPDNYATVSTAVNESTLEDMVETVLDSAGSVRAIIGTRKALMPIYKFAGIHEQLKLSSSPATDSNPNAFPINSILEEWARTGRLTQWRGIPLVVVPQVLKRTFDAFDTKLVRDDIIKVVGDDVGEAINFGGVEFWDRTDDRYDFAPEYQIAAKREFGAYIDYPERLGIIQIV